MRLTASARNGRVRALLCGFAAWLCVPAPVWAQQPTVQPMPADEQRALTLRLDKEFKGDLDALVARRAIHVAVPYSRTLYFNDKGRERGLSADFVRDFDKYYVAYRLMTELEQMQREAREGVQPGK